MHSDLKAIRRTLQAPARTRGDCLRMHGEGTQVQRAAARRVQEHGAREILGRLGRPVPTDPITALRDLIAEAAGNVEVLRALVAEKRFPADLVADDPVLDLYGRNRDPLHRIAKDATVLALDERRLRIDAQLADRLVAMLDRVLGTPELGLDDERREMFRRLFADECCRARTSTRTNCGGISQVSMRGGPVVKRLLTYEQAARCSTSPAGRCLAQGRGRCDRCRRRRWSALNSRGSATSHMSMLTRFRRAGTGAPLEDPQEHLQLVQRRYRLRPAPHRVRRLWEDAAPNGP